MPFVLDSHVSLAWVLLEKSNPTLEPLLEGLTTEMVKDIRRVILIQYVSATDAKQNLAAIIDVAQREPVVIRPDGKNSLGLIGAVVASGLTADRVAQTIAEKYKAVKENPSVSVAHHETVPGLLFVTSLKNMGKFLASSLS